MIDLETLALSEDAIVLSVGAVVTFLDKLNWNYETPVFSFNVDIDQPGRKFNASTLTWHLQQDPEVVKETFKGPRFPLTTVLINLSEYISSWQPDTIWCKGVEFDIAILEHAYLGADLSIPWNYRQRRCFRTLEAYALYEEWKVKPVASPTKKHTALDDAIYQAEILYNIVNRDRERSPF